MTWGGYVRLGTADVPYTLFDGVDEEAHLWINQARYPDDVLDDDSHMWESLGTYEITSGNFTVHMSDEYSVGFVLDADAIKLVMREGPAETPELIDDGDLGYREAGDGWGVVSKQGYDSEQRFNDAGTGSATAAWTFDGLVPAPYEVLISWHARTDATTDAPFEVLDDQVDRGTVNVNQQQEPQTEVTSKENILGQLYETWWESLGTFQVDSGTLNVQLSDDVASGLVLADAVRIRPMNPLPVTNYDATVVYQDGAAVTLDALANDTTAPDEGETLTITEVSARTAGGTIAVVGDTQVDYTPAPGFIGEERFGYTVTDGFPGNYETAVVTVTVLPTGAILLHEDGGGLGRRGHVHADRPRPGTGDPNAALRRVGCVR